MKRIIKIAVAIAIFSGGWSMVHAQSLSRQVFSTAGGTMISGANMLTFNIGEPAIETLTALSTQLTQGFEQPGEEIETGLAPLSICAGSTFNLPYTAMDIGGGNTFTVQLSDALGNFASPTNIGTLAGNASSGSISVTIPANTPAGSGYRIRVLSSSPALTSGDNGTNIQINALPTPVITGNTTICTGASTTLNAGLYSSYSWSGGANTATIAADTAGTYIVTVTDANGCTGLASAIVSLRPGPINLTTTNITQATALANWASAGSGTTYCFEKRMVGATSFDPQYKTTKIKWQMKNMLANTQYEWHVRIQCAPSQYSDWSPLQTFTTTAAPCTTKPTGLSVSNKTTTSAQLNWSMLGPVPDNYQIHYRLFGTSTWTITQGAGTAVQKVLTGLSPGSKYQWQLRGRCGSAAPYDYSNWSAVSSFTLPTVRMGDINYEAPFSVYPNPSTGLFTLSITAPKAATYTVKVTDLQGRLIITNNYNAEEGEQQFNIDMTGSAKGIYMLYLSDESHTQIEKLVVQ